MAVSKEKKQNVLAHLAGIADSASLVFVGFRGLLGGESAAMRRALREKGVGYLVAKKTLIARALAGRYAGEAPALAGEVALAYGADPLTPAQSIREFARQYAERLWIQGGVYEGAYKSREEMTEIASIPSLEVLRGMFVNVINSPIAGLAMALNAIATKKAN